MSRLQEVPDLADTIAHKVLQLRAERDELLRELVCRARETLERDKEYIMVYEAVIVERNCARQSSERLERMLQVR